MCIDSVLIVCVFGGGTACSYLVVRCFVFFLMIRRPPRSTLERSSAASDVYKRQLLHQVQLGDKLQHHAAALPHGDQRKLEVALLMALDPQVYMFDEPTAGMSVDDVPVVLDLIRALKRRKDRTILLVEHKMDVVRELSDRIVVLHNGQLVADGEPAEVIASPVVQQAYLGMAAEEPA